MCNTFAVYFQIFATFGYKKVKNSDTVVSCVHILTHDQRKPLKASPLIAAVRPGAIMRRRSRLY